MTGLRRYVHIAFAVMGLIAAYLLTNIFEMIGGLLSFSYPILGIDITSYIALLIAIVGTIVLWRNEKIFTFGEEVAKELKKVTWPTYEETRTSTVVVCIMIAIFAMILGLFDFMWSGVTNFLVQTLT